MTNLAISHNAEAVAATLDAVSRRQFPFALANGINRTMEEIQIETRRKLPTQFTFRNARARRFFEALIYIRRGDRARKDRLVGTVGVHGNKKADILAKFQQAGERRARPGGTPLAYPTDYLKPQPSAVIPQSLFPRALGLLASRTVEGKRRIRGARIRELGNGEVKVRLLGKRRTFAIDPRFHPSAQSFGVWRREGRGRASETNRLWVYTSRLRHPKRLTFLEDAQRLTQTRLALNVEGQLRYALNDLKQYRASRFARVARAQGRI